MPSFNVIWEIQIDADSHLAAAKQALEIQRDPCSSAVCFDVFQNGGLAGPKHIDLHDTDDTLLED